MPELPHPSKSLSLLLWPSCFGVFWLAGKLLHPIALNPDSEIPTAAVIGSGLIFLAWIMGIRCWGRWLTHRLVGRNHPLGIEFAFGTLWAVAIVCLLGSFRLLGPSSEYLVVPLLWGGTFLRTPSRTIKISLGDSFSYTTILFLTIAGALIAVVPQNHSDPLLYSLVGPRLWHLAGAIEQIPKFPQVMICRYWEYLFVWPNSLLSGVEGQGLYEVMAFSQWTHAVLGWGGTMLLLFALLRRAGLNASWSLLGSITASRSDIFVWTVPLARNDWGIVFWTLAGLYLLEFPLWAGVFFGIAFAGKYTVAPTLVAILAIRLIVDRRKPKSDFLWIALGFVLANLPLLIRNFNDTGNPFYPLFYRWFTSPWLTEYISVRDLAGQNSQWTFMGLVLARLELLWRLNPEILLAPFLIFLISRAKFKNLNFLVAGPISGILFLLVVGGSKSIEDGNHYLRWWGPGLVLSSALMVGVVWTFVGHQFKSILPMTIALVLGLNVHLPFKVIADLPRRISAIPIELRTQFLAGDSKAWLRLNAKPGDLIVSLGDDQLYFVSHLRIAVSSEQPALERLAKTSFDTVDFLRKLDAIGVKFLLSSAHFSGGYWTREGEAVHAYLRESSKSVVYHGLASDIIDSRELLWQIAQSCVLPDLSILDQDPSLGFL